MVGSTASGEASVKKCAAVEVQSVNVTSEILAPRKQAPKVEITEEKKSGTSRDRVSIVAYGPVLGSMDSSKVDVDFTCTEEGVILNARITRSANFSGGALQNVTWRPEIRMVVTISKAEAILETVWRMVLTNGQESTKTQTPPYPPQEYPAKAVRRIHY
jgi:hypothetical protein